MDKHQSLKEVFGHLEARNLSAAINELENFLSVHPNQVNSDRLHAVRTDYQLMTDYWKRGFKDPQLPALYQSLLQRVYVLSANISRSYAIGHNSFLSSIYLRQHMSARDWSPQNIREELETFVSDVAILELEPPQKREVKQRELYRQHQHDMNVLFDRILTSDIWTDGIATMVEEMLLSPTVDTNDQQLIISSIMLSTIEHFDMAKFRTLIHVYEKAIDERVRQRALVGWVMTLDSGLAASIYPEQIDLVHQLLEDENHCKELVELQEQIVFCMNAEQDTQTIQREIMPDLMKNQSFRMTRNGIEETEEDPMEDILHPGEQERKMEKMEASFQRMVNMQKQGSDIYFGGFSQMKRFTFFSELSNWFVPFYPNHPDVVEVMDKTGLTRFLNVMVEKGPFCNSDKYSFVFAFQQVINQIPQNMREMLERGEATFNELATEELESPAYIRRTYLQDLYRFFRLFPLRVAFVNPFDVVNNRYLFFADPIFSKTHLELFFNDVTAFFLKQDRLYNVLKLLSNYGEARRDFQFWMMYGYLAQHYANESALAFSDLQCYANALEIQPDHERALAGLGRALFSREMYEEALETYDQLLMICPDKKSYRLNFAVSLTNLGRYDEALKDLYRLDYLLTASNVHPDDLLNYGYSLWFSGHIDEAADCFHRFLKETGYDPDFILENEAVLLREKGVTEPEQQMMLYIL